MRPRGCRFLGALIGLAMLGRSAAAQTPGQISPLTLDAAIERALSANPAIAAARLRAGIGTAGLGIARERLNPEVRVEFERETPTESYSLAVPWEAGGKRSRRIAVANAAIRTGEAEIAQVIAETRASVRRAYYTRLIAEARLTLLTELQDLSGRARDAAQQRFDAGSIPRLEVLQAQLAVADLGNQVTAAAGAGAAARAQLNALLGLPIDAATPLATLLDAPVATIGDAALAKARAANSELLVAERRLDEQRARLALARSLQTPDITPEAAITHGNEPEFNFGWRAAVAVSVPLFTRHRAGVVLEDATLKQLTAERDAVLARVTGDVTAALALADAQQRQYVRYRDEILPQALEVERMAEDAFRLGQTGIAAFLQALQATRDTRLRSLESASGLHAALADLERAIGAPLP
jgi:cobalt-zinc-cadmium efflux system outer membrane protein